MKHPSTCKQQLMRQSSEGEERKYTQKDGWDNSREREGEIEDCSRDQEERKANQIRVDHLHYWPKMCPHLVCCYHVPDVVLSNLRQEFQCNFKSGFSFLRLLLLLISYSYSRMELGIHSSPFNSFGHQIECLTRDFKPFYKCRKSCLSNLINHEARQGIMFRQQMMTDGINTLASFALPFKDSHHHPAQNPAQFFTI